jgi:tRNA/tmRNA/rRNA uracil-C5-methylase (TrmA/RlmC/RlmD family)
MTSSTFIVEKIVHGGDGLIRDGGRAIFVPFVIPGERIEIRLETGKGKALRPAPSSAAAAAAASSTSPIRPS